MADLCTGPSCTRKVRAMGLCDSHYRQLRAGRELRPIALRQHGLGWARRLLRLAAEELAASPKDPTSPRRLVAERRLEVAAVRFSRTRTRLIRAARAAKNEQSLKPVETAA